VNASPPLTVADRVRKRIRAAEVSQEELGAKLGLSQPAVSRRMSGALSWRLDELKKLAVVLGIPLADLIGSSSFTATPSGQPAAQAS
jgi:transcriptional regulator with XRE-family HTH domain